MLCPIPSKIFSYDFHKTQNLFSGASMFSMGLHRCPDNFTIYMNDLYFFYEDFKGLCFHVGIPVRPTFCLVIIFCFDLFFL